MTKGSTNKLMIVLLLVTAILTGTAQAAPGSWFIDGPRRHVSAHGELSCLDCHTQTDLETHPDPKVLHRSQVAPFDPETCAGCHDTPEAYLATGEHGGRKIESLDQVAGCPACHDPHYQLSPTINAAFDPARPVRQQCASCHKQPSGLFEAEKADRPCLDCHLQPEKGDSQASGRSARFCLSCHARTNGVGPDQAMPWINGENLRTSPHAALSCRDCHPGADDFDHKGQPSVECLGCHTRHDERKAHDAHMSVTCQACHLEGVQPLKDRATGTVSWEIKTATGQPLAVHALTNAEDEESCRRCHASGNTVGAAAAVLPAKSILCLPCHAATLSVGDPITVVALVILVAGLFWLGSIWTAGTGAPGEHRAGERPSVAKVLLWDVLLQRRLWQRSPGRWVIHGLIFYGLLLRFLWGLAALVLSLAAPEWAVTWILVDKNASSTALIFDLTGLMILVGVGAAGFRHLARTTSKATAGLPRSDWPALVLLGACALSGFAAEGLRMAMTGAPPASAWAFIGSLTGSMFTGRAGLTEAYPFLWYLHAGLCGALAAYLPFSRLLHVILAPMVLVMNSARKQ